MTYTTRKSLLQKVVQGNEFSWTEFYRTYSPLIRRRGRDFYLNDVELDELVQAVMLEFATKEIIGNKFDMKHIPDGLTGCYNKKKGRFRDFLRAVVTNHAYKILRARKVDLSTEDELNLDTIASQKNELEEAWNKEWNDHILVQAMNELKEQVEPKTYQAFEMRVLQDKDVKDIAAFLDISEDSVYQAKSRCTKMLRLIIAELEALA